MIYRLPTKRWDCIAPSFDIKQLWFLVCLANENRDWFQVEYVEGQ